MDTETTVQKDLFQDTTNKMISILEKGVVPWRSVWGEYGIPRNQATLRPYAGINMILMSNTEQPIPYFMSFKQVKKLKGSVKKGAKAKHTLYTTLQLKNEAGQLITKEEALALQSKQMPFQTTIDLEYSNVFNVEDITGIEFDFQKVGAISEEQKKGWDKFLVDLPNCPEIEPDGEHTSWYDANEDTIHIPYFEKFDSLIIYYSVLFRYLIQATGHEKRLARKGEYDVFKKPNYSEEELIIDIGAAFLCAHLGIDYGTAMNQLYAEHLEADLKGWKQALQSDKFLLFCATAQAQKAVNYLLGK